MYNVKKRVLLISMPWSLLYQPSLAPGILKSVLLKQNIPCDVLYAAMYLLKYVTYGTYEWMSRMWALDDFVFTNIFETKVSQVQLKTISKVFEGHTYSFDYKYSKNLSNDKNIDTILRLRQEIIPRFLDDLIEEIDFHSYSMVGFSCLFDQTIASLALARKIKKIYPNMFIAFGGISLAKPIGPALQRSFPEMDVVAYGDGEPVIVPLAEAACGERSFCDVPNITYRNEVGEVAESNVTSWIDLNDSPAPNYDNYFRSMEEMWEKHQVRFRVGEIPVESSRGCLWGAKVGCTFCSLDRDSKQYRVKSGNTVMHQLDEMHRKYDKYLSTFSFNDRMMPQENYDDLLPKLKARGAPYAITYSIRPDMSWDQFELCSRSGVFRLNPGIENFSTPVLRLMKKGVKGIQNFFTIFAAMCNRIVCLYNFIWGFPGENISDYVALAKLLPSMSHLIPPVSNRPIMIVRYSELAENPNKFGIETPLRAHWRYDVVFSTHFIKENKISPNEFCYRYDEKEIRQFSPEALTIFHIIQRQLLNWREKFANKKSRLSHVMTNDHIIINDRRYDDGEKVYRFNSVYKHLCEVVFGKICEEGKIFHDMSKYGFTNHKVKPALNKLCELRVIIKEDNKYIWIAFPDDFYKDDLSWLFNNQNTKLDMPFTTKQNA